jgi:hypothetical protein
MPVNSSTGSPAHVPLVDARRLSSEDKADSHSSNRNGWWDVDTDLAVNPETWASHGVNSEIRGR